MLGVHKNKTYRMRCGFFVLLLGFVLGLSACNPAKTAGDVAASVGVAATQERPLSTAARDLAIQAQIGEKLFQKDLSLFGKTGVTVVEGRVLLTGAIRNQDFIDDVSQIAWSVPGVNAVYNEIQVYTGDTSVDLGKDSVINGKLRAAIVRDRAINDVNYYIDVSRGTIYLMGVARDQAEIDRVLSYAREISSVRRVVSHVMLKDDPRRKRQ